MGFYISIGIAALSCIFCSIGYWALCYDKKKLLIKLTRAQEDLQVVQEKLSVANNSITHFQTTLKTWEDYYKAANVKLEVLTTENEQLRLDKQKILSDWERETPIIIKKAREQAVEASRAVLKGKISEHVAPLMANFPYKLSDLRFLGSPIDFLCLDGLSEGKIRNVVLMDIKTGDASLSERQKQIQNLIENCNVKFEVFRMD